MRLSDSVVLRSKTPGRVRPARTRESESLLVESLAVLASWTTASAGLTILRLDVVSLGTTGVVVIHLAVRFILGMPWIRFHGSHLLSNVLN